eukprot:scaffold45224_cov97-Phaeocystis_antarctica.AAC.1
MDGELGARGRAARAPGRSAGCRGARRRGTPPLLAHSTCVPTASLMAAPQVAGQRAAATKEHSASGRSARVGSEAAPRACAACAPASVYSENIYAVGALMAR